MLLKVGLIQEHPWVHWEKGAEGSWTKLVAMKEACMRGHACVTKEDERSNAFLRYKEVCLRCRIVCKPQLSFGKVNLNVKCRNI
uniref:Uncharacterized protein n=1 Tax=Glossina palpalis gambiensis TaxID=67801 RepID=A0A1B0C6D1_9MUSC